MQAGGSCSTKDGNVSHPGDRPLVSVVTPFDNDGPRLRASLESVLCQTYQEIEYVLVDDRSTDGSSEIAAEYARRDPRIRLIRSETPRGRIASRNDGMDRISPSSKYCKLVLAGDWLFPQCVDAMVAVAEANPSVALVGAYGLLDATVYLTGLRYWQTVIPGPEVCRGYLLEGLYLTGGPTATLVRADLVRARHPFYGERTPIGDLAVCFDLLRDGDLGFVHQVLTFTQPRNDPIASRPRPYHAALLAELLMLETYGPTFLGAGELRERRRQLRRAYYEDLSEALLRRRPAEFWEFHRHALESVGLRIQPGQVTLGMGRTLADLLLNPRITVNRLVAAAGRRREAARRHPDRSVVRLSSGSAG
jgi:glycosyltransferase involved in cell wall biosynthesis